MSKNHLMLRSLFVPRFSSCARVPFSGREPSCGLIWHRCSICSRTSWLKGCSPSPTGFHATTRRGSWRSAWPRSAQTRQPSRNLSCKKGMFPLTSLETFFNILFQGCDYERPTRDRSSSRSLQSHVGQRPEHGTLRQKSK